MHSYGVDERCIVMYREGKGSVWPIQEERSKGKALCGMVLQRQSIARFCKGIA